MPSFILHQGAIVTCSHGGQATPMVPSVRVSVGGMAAVTMASPYCVAGCPLQAPCVTAQWTVAATRVTSMGQALAIMAGQSNCAAPGTPLLPLATQTRVLVT